MRVLRQNPDVIAVVILALAMLAPEIRAAHPTRGEAFTFRPASSEEMRVLTNLDSVRGFEGMNDWTAILERRGERVWQRFAERMRAFEERFERLSTLPPKVHAIECEMDSE